MNNSQITKAYLGSTSVVEGRKGTQLVLAPNGNALWYTANQRPSLDLRFAENKSLVDATTGQNLVTFTRASDGTYVGSDGVIKTATTNLYAYSIDFSASPWSTVRATRSANAAIAPDGSSNAIKLIEDTTASASHYLAAFTTPSFVSEIAYTQSVYAKAGERTRFQMALPSAAFTTETRVLFDLGAQTATLQTGSASAAITNTGNGWYRCSMTATATATITASVILCYIENGSSITYTGNGTSGLFLWGAQLEQSSTVGEYIPTTSTINSAPRFDHNPTTGESLGLLVEEQRTNSIRNNTMVGAVAGTPGTLPTNWSNSGLGTLTQQVVGVGTENGVNYIDLRISGTTSTTQYGIRLESSSGVAGTNGQTFTFSTWLYRVGGSSANLTQVATNANIYDSTTAYLTSISFNGFSSSVGTTLTRLSGTGTIASATAAYIQPQIYISFNSGVAIDITLRIGLPQLEQGAFATSVIPTSTVAVTRSADVASITGTNFSSWYNGLTGTLFTDTSIGYTVPGTQFPLVGSFNDGTNNNRIENGFLTSAVAGFEVTTGGVSQVQSYPVTSALSRKLAGAYSTNDFAASANGGSAATDSSGSLPVVDRLFIGSRTGGGGVNSLNGTIRRLTFWPQRLSNSTLQTLTQ